MSSTVRHRIFFAFIVASALLPPPYSTADTVPISLPPLKAVKTLSSKSGVVWTHEGRANRDVILLVHGWNGDRFTTWSALSKLFLADRRLAQFDVATFGYPTGCSWTRPGIDDTAAALAKFVDTELQGYDRVHIVSHSLGGLVAQRYIVDVLAKRGRGALKTETLLLLASPSEGVRWYVGFFGGLFCGAQASQARSTSAFISSLRADWIKHVQDGGAKEIPESNRKNIPVVSLVATDDLLVEIDSASSHFTNQIVKSTHTGIKALVSYTDKIYKLMTNALRTKPFSFTSVSDWVPDLTLKKYLMNWRESIRFQPEVLLNTHAATTRWTYIFRGNEVYVVLEKAGYYISDFGAAQKALNVGVSYKLRKAFDVARKKPATPRARPIVDKQDLPYSEYDIGDSFDLMFTYQAKRGSPFCAPGDPYGIISATNNTEIVLRVTRVRSIFLPSCL